MLDFDFKVLENLVPLIFVILAVAANFIRLLIKNNSKANKSSFPKSEPGTVPQQQRPPSILKEFLDAMVDERTIQQAKKPIETPKPASMLQEEDAAPSVIADANNVYISPLDEDLANKRTKKLSKKEEIEKVFKKAAAEKEVFKKVKPKSNPIVANQEGTFRKTKSAQENLKEILKKYENKPLTQAIIMSTIINKKY